MNFLKKINEVSRFNYVISHNLRSSIASIIGLSDIINIPTLSEPEKLKIVDYIRDSSLKMDELIRDLGAVLEASDTLDVKKEWVSIPLLIQQTIDIFETQIKKYNIDLKITISENAKEIYTLKKYLESILYQLFSNAIKFKKQIETPQIIIEVHTLKEQMYLSISDNGLGIDLERHGDHIFGLYKRFHRESEGKGLGLLIAKTQAEALGGNITVESLVDIGSVFCLSLPLSVTSEQ